VRRLFEDPTTIIVAGLIVEGFLGLALYRTGRGKLLWWMGGVAALVVALVALERAVVTEEETVADTLDAIADALEDNNPPKVIGWIAPESGVIRDRAAAELGNVNIRSARVTGVTVTVDRSKNPRTAEVKFVGKVNAAYQGQDFGNYIREFTVQLRKEGNRWLVVRYRHDPLGGRSADRPAPPDQY
jgi:hypothetical protein